MNLYDVPRGSKVRVIKAESPPPGGAAPITGQIYTLHNIDGMYSFCTDSAGGVIHLKAWTDVEIVK